MKFLEETILIISVGWMVIYLYGLYKLSSAAYSHSLFLIPVLLFLFLFIVFWKKYKVNK